MIKWAFNSYYSKQVRRIRKSFNRQKTQFNTHCVDITIAHLANKIYKNNQQKFEPFHKPLNNKLGVCATELYDVAGHTPLVINFIKSFYTLYSLKCFLTYKDKTINTFAPQRSVELKTYTELIGPDTKSDFVTKIIDLYNSIVKSNVKVIAVFIHMDDVVMTAVLALLKKHTSVQVLFFNHADHLPVLGMAFSDLILDFRPAGYRLTETERKYTNHQLVDLQSVPRCENKVFTMAERVKRRSRWGKTAHDLITLTGCNGTKLFDSSNKSPYFEMIKELLNCKPSLTHIVVSHLTDDQKAVVESIFKENQSVRNRLMIVPFEKEFEIMFQSADLFIDSFPQGSALTHIDCMRGKVPTVVKINQNNPFKSFEYYLPENYTFKFANTDDMLKGIVRLLDSPDLRKQTGEKLYEYYLKRFEFAVVKHTYHQIIEDYSVR